MEVGVISMKTTMTNFFSSAQELNKSLQKQV
jgi:hypothetical protein